MAHFAELDSNNVVIRVVVVEDSNVSADMAADGETWCENNISDDPSIAFVDGAYPGVSWKQTSYNNSFRGRFAYVGGKFIADGGNGYFQTKKEIDSWVNVTSNEFFEPPGGTPNVQTYDADGKTYSWNILWSNDLEKFTATKTTKKDPAINQGSSDTVRTVFVEDQSASNVEEVVVSPTADQTKVYTWNGSSWE